ncbi:MAG: T9SS type A sorting domain-containing protein [Bacteroidia bacterium]|nr:T9SS type A sorting domain-containing protein [Bacteroidia bacterium]
MKNLLILISLLIPSNIQAQNSISATWLRHTCGYTNGVNLLGGDVWGDAVCADKFGNSYNSGSAQGYWFTMDTVIEMNIGKFYINKYDAAGMRVWTATARGTTINSIMSSSRMKCDSLGNVYVCGTFSVDDSVYMAPNWYPVGSGYVAKYDANGNNLWCAYVPRTGTAYVSFTDMSLVNGALYVCGIMGPGTQTFGSFSFNSSATQNGVIAKLDLSGNVLHAEQLDPNSVNEVYGIEVSANTNEIYVVGQYSSDSLKVDNEVLHIDSDAQNSFIVKYNNSFSALWAKKCITYLHINQVVGSSISCLTRIEIDKFDNIYVSANGNGDSTVIGALSFTHRIHPTIEYAQDIYIAKLNSNGQEIWLRNGGSDGMDIATDLATDEWGNSIISVYSSQQSLSGLIFGNDTMPQWHGGIVKFDPSGNLLYTQILQQARTLQALAMSKDSTFYGTGNGFNPGIPYINLSIPQCEDTINGYYNPPYKMVMVKFFDNYGNFTTAEGDADLPTKIFRISPNPTDQFIYITFEDRSNKYAEILILDVAGRILSQGTSNADTRIDVSQLPDGLYLVRVIRGNKIETMKFLKY